MRKILSDKELLAIYEYENECGMKEKKVIYR